MTTKKPSPGAADPKDPAALAAAVADLTAQVRKLTDIAARAQADLQNAKLRLERDRGELGKFAVESLLKRLLPTIDSFRRAFLHLPEDLRSHEWVKGVAAIEQQLMMELRQAGLTPMAPLGKPIDPERHEILLEGPGERGTVVEVLEEGYELHGKVLRPAKVKAGSGQ